MFAAGMDTGWTPFAETFGTGLPLPDREKRCILFPLISFLVVRAGWTHPFPSRTRQ